MKVKQKKKYRILVWGGLGDGLILTPTFKALKLREPNCRVIAYVYRDGIHDQLLINNPYVDKVVKFHPFKTPFAGIRYLLNRKSFRLAAYAETIPSVFYRNTHATEIVGKMLDVEIIDRQIQICITKEEDEKAQKILSKYNNPILIQVTSSSASDHNWPCEKWEELIRRMSNCTFIQVGNNSEKEIKGAVNLLGKTSLRESLALLKNAKSFVAVASFMNHASNAFLKKGVVFFGPSIPGVWGYSHNININKNMACSPCIDILLGSPCPYKAECIQSISVDEVEEALETQLASIGNLVQV